MATLITLTEFILETRVNFKASADAPVDRRGKRTTQGAGIFGSIPKLRNFGIGGRGFDMILGLSPLEAKL